MSAPANLAIESARRAARMTLLAHNEPLALTILFNVITEEARARGMSLADRAEALSASLALTIHNHAADDDCARGLMQQAAGLAGAQLGALIRHKIPRTGAPSKPDTTSPGDTA